MAGASDEFVEATSSTDSEDYQAFLDDYSVRSAPVSEGEDSSVTSSACPTKKSSSTSAAKSKAWFRPIAVPSV